MDTINFFTPIRYEKPNTWMQYAEECVEDYFYLGGKSICVISGEKPSDPSENQTAQMFLGALKIISYMTVVIPLIMLTAKIIFRAAHKLNLLSSSKEISEKSPPPQLELAGQTSASNPPSSSEEISEESPPSQLDVADQTPTSNPLSSSKEISEESSPPQLDVADQTSTSLSSASSKAISEKSPPLQLDTLPPALTPIVRVRGLPNIGNSCYINAALQPLLAIRNFKQLIPNDVSPNPPETLKLRRDILAAFKDFFEAWEKNLPQKTLVEKIQLLREQIFKAGLPEGGLSNQTTGVFGSFLSNKDAPQDSGQVFGLILYILGQQFQEQIRRTPVDHEGTPITAHTITEQHPYVVLHVTKRGSSIQEMVNAYQNPERKDFSAGSSWEIENPDGTATYYLASEEMVKIATAPPPILVFRVDSYIVQPKLDHQIDCAALFQTPGENSEYELVGFSQNLRQCHWTAVVYDGHDWQYCNDSSITKISPEEREFRNPAHYMVYRKKERSAPGEMQEQPHSVEQPLAKT